MTLEEFRNKLDPVDQMAVNILYNLYTELYTNTDSSSTIDDIGYYKLLLTDKYGKEIIDEFLETVELKELIEKNA